MIQDILVKLDKYHLGSLTKMCHIIYKSGDVYWILVDTEEKLDDVNKMPKYIQEDFIKYNSKPLKFDQINEHIKDIEYKLNQNKIDAQSYWVSSLEERAYENLIKLKELKREFILKNLLD